MKRLLTIVSLVAFSAVAASAATPSPTRPAAAKAPAKPVIPSVKFLKYRVAPADEYFGRLKLSILGIRNTIKDMGLKADADPVHATGVIGGIGLTEDAMRDWEKKYPQDTWIPATILSLERLYAKVDSDNARSRAKLTMRWLLHDYPKSPPGKVAETELKRNLVGVKPAAPLAAEAVDPALSAQAK